MKKMISIVLALSMVALCGCQSVTPPSAGKAAGKPELLTNVVYPESAAADDYEKSYALREQNQVDQSVTDAANAFAYATAAQLLASRGGKNSNYSPISLYFALALGAQGAKGATLDEFLQLMRLDGADDLQNVSTLYRLLYSDNTVSKLKIANSLWLGIGYAFNDEYLRTAQDDLYASLYTADFASDDTSAAIAKWISDNTNATLSPQLEFDPETLMTIINTIYFYDEWLTPFLKDDTAPAVFHAASGDVQCDFMNSSSAGSVYIGDDYSKCERYFADGAKMVFILPGEGSDVDALLSDADLLADAITKECESVGQLKLHLPKFTFKTDYDIKAALEAMGVANMFSDRADLTGISPDAANISQIKQGTYIALDEYGVEASAYTAMMISTTGMLSGEAELTFDRPFIYAIVDEGTVIFIGVLETPAA